MTLIQCTGRDGVTRDFNYMYEQDELDKVYHFTVESVPRSGGFQTFEITFTPIYANTVRQTNIINPKTPEYLAKGIPDAMLPEVKRVLGMEVESSLQYGIQPGVFRSEEAEKMRRRLVGKGIAEYDDVRKVYRVK